MRWKTGRRQAAGKGGDGRVFGLVSKADKVPAVRPRILQQVSRLRYSVSSDWGANFPTFLRPHGTPVTTRGYNADTQRRGACTHTQSLYEDTHTTTLDLEPRHTRAARRGARQCDKSITARSAAAVLRCLITVLCGLRGVRDCAGRALRVPWFILE